jgi:CheY-like chemotaxis protein
LLAGVPLLVVEDDPPSRRLLRAVLEGEGSELRVATSAEEALSVLESFRPRLIVIDLILPLMGGLVLAQTLKANPLTSSIPLVAVTAFNGAAAERMALDVGFVAYVRKPMDPASFCQLVVEHLGGGS